jgi:hypothetical protein
MSNASQPKLPALPASCASVASAAALPCPVHFVCISRILAFCSVATCVIAAALIYAIPFHHAYEPYYFFESIEAAKSTEFNYSANSAVIFFLKCFSLIKEFRLFFCGRFSQ